MQCAFTVRKSRRGLNSAAPQKLTVGATKLQPPNSTDMPHKHVRRRGDGDQSQFDLAPTQLAKALPTFEQKSNGKAKSNKKDDVQRQQKLKRKREAAKSGYKHDDTPRQFARIMHQQATGKRPNGLDDGNPERKKKKQKVASGTTEQEPSKQALDSVADKSSIPKILPGEKLSDYAARVDQALPVSGLAKKGKSKIEGMKERQTKTEKRLHKLYASWREEEARLKEKEEERQEQEEEDEAEKELAYGGDVKFPESRKKRRRMVGESNERDEDPWAVLKQRRKQDEREQEDEKADQRSRKGGLRGLHDVVQAPPSMKVVPKEKFKVKGNAKVDILNVPSAAGSLKRREELSDARKEVIERYRAMMKAGGKGGL